MSVSTSTNLKIESLQLFREYQRTKSLKLRNQIMQLNFGLVRKEAYHWVKQCNESYEDLVQVGCLGLIRAVERFNLEKGHAFSSFAIPYIRGEIQHYLRDKGHTVRIPRRWQEQQRKAVYVIRALRETLRRQPTDLEIAQELEISIGEWQEIKLAHQNQEPLSLDISVGDREDGKTSLGEIVVDPKHRSFELAQEDRLRLQQALGQLEHRTREVLEFVFLQDLTQKETAERLGISVVTVSRRVKKGIEMLKTAMNNA